MKLWLRLSLAGMIPVTILLCAELAAAKANDAPSSYDEVTAPDDWQAVAIVPPDPNRTPPQSYAIVTVPEQAAHGSTSERGAPQTLASLPAGPPLTVLIRFDPRRADNASRASLIATALGREGIPARVIGPAVVATSDDIGFVFAEDEAAAAELAHHLAGTIGHAAQIRLEPHQSGDAAPGTIEITLGNERGTS